MHEIIIIGNSGSARECYWLLNDVFKADKTFTDNHFFKGFLAWKDYAGDLKEMASYALGSAQNHQVSNNQLFIIGVGLPSIRAEIYEVFKERNALFMNLVHPLADICPSAIVGEANILHRGSTVYCNAVIGNANYLNGYVNIAHDVVLGDYNFIAPGSMILGSATVGSRNRFAPSTIVLDKASVGDNNIIAPASVLYKGCGSNCRMAGNPALKIA